MTDITEGRRLYAKMDREHAKPLHDNGETAAWKRSEVMAWFLHNGRALLDELEQHRLIAQLCQHLCAENDDNGNPRRCYVIYSGDGEVTAIHDEQNSGPSAVPGFREMIHLPRINVSPREYQSFIDWFKE